MSPKRLKNGMKPSLYPVRISKILPKPLPRLFLDPSYGPAYSGKAFFPSGITHSSTFLHLFTDASDLGCGFSSNWHQFHITDREFHQIVISLEHWCNQSHN